MKLLYVVMAFAASLSITSLEFDPTPSETLSFAEVGRDCSKVATNTPAGQYFQSPERPYNVSMGSHPRYQSHNSTARLGSRSPIVQG